MTWTHNDPEGDEGWAYDQGELIRGEYCPDCLSSIARLRHNWNTMHNFVVYVTTKLEIRAKSEDEAVRIARAKNLSKQEWDYDVSLA